MDAIEQIRQILEEEKDGRLSREEALSKIVQVALEELDAPKKMEPLN